MATTWTKIQRRGRKPQSAIMLEATTITHENRFNILAEEGDEEHETTQTSAVNGPRPRGSLQPWDISPSLYPVKAVISAASKGGQFIRIKDIPISNRFSRLEPELSCPGPTPDWAPRPRLSLWPQDISISLHPLHRAPHPNLAEKVFAIPELFDNIFAPILQDNINREPTETERECPSARFLLHNRVVCKAFKDNIDGSSLLQDLMFFNTPNTSSRPLWQNASVRLKKAGYRRGGNSISLPVLTRHGMNEILLRRMRRGHVFRTPTVSTKERTSVYWFLEYVRIGVEPTECIAGAKIPPTFQSSITVSLSKQGGFPLSCYSHQVEQPGPYLNMRFADPCCRVIMIGTIGHRGHNSPESYRMIKAEMKAGASFGEILDWLDMWDSERYESSDVVKTVLWAEP